ncbi:hypothetical protein N5D61_10245 [Pseudomonas sp. GD03842]|uniref:hypothetical protein n=1 Tax=unclassified Pseudomonas TaxID=196821 RepID=UPI000D39EBF9|nr:MULTISPECIES: hypothetical protein [unclassified Pseudomonas]MDH0746725.1 hypothetical protein [Pseudomonas sp. GD03842]RAU45809.1 hypothetical protein DBP26_012590 [Pseudomonas sp. RIT 409]RAU56092.1 hypothetical protein DBY65_002905 [Pseudomonas sp. RIT 412]
MRGANFWVIVFFALINNGCSLLGHGEGSVGGVARSMEFKTEVAQDIEMLRAQRLTAGHPPPKQGELFSTIFQWSVA